jgi:enoyl-CoA hydratase
VSDEVLVEHLDRIVLITINRPHARNAINRAVTLGVAAALDELDASDHLALGVLTGAGGSFCAGMDLNAFLTGEAVTLPGRGLAGMCERPPRKPMIAAIEGWALAGGFELALACDLIVAAEDAKLGIPEVKRGMVATAGGLLRLPRRVPPAIAMQMALTGDPMSADDALRYGLVNSLVPPGAAVEGALELAARITCNGPLALAATKDILMNATDWTVAEGFAIQQTIAEPVFSSNDAREGALAFAEKREPVWTGR